MNALSRFRPLLGMAAGLMLVAGLQNVASARQVESGYASWYNRGFHGLKTANGDTYDHEALTGAHRTLPFGTLVRVSRTDTGANVVVRINDRMESGPGHVIDLSGGAASALDLLRVGASRVRVEVIGTATAGWPGTSPAHAAAGRPGASPAPSAPGWPGTSPAPAEARFTLQLGAYTSLDAAQRLAGRYADAYIVAGQDGPTSTWRVFYRSFGDEVSARAEQDRLWRSGQDSFLRRLGASGIRAAADSR